MKKMDAATLIALTISNNHARYFNQDRKSLITSNEQIIKLVNANVMKLTMRNQKTKLKRIDHRNMPKNLTNLENLPAQYKNPRTEPSEEENDDIDFAEIKTDDDNNVIKISYLTQEFNKVQSMTTI